MSTIDQHRISTPVSRSLEATVVGWRVAAGASTEALHRWRDAERQDAAAAYVSYVAALDREQAAALVLQRLTARLPVAPA